MGGSLAPLPLCGRNSFRYAGRNATATLILLWEPRCGRTSCRYPERSTTSWEVGGDLGGDRAIVVARTVDAVEVRDLAHPGELAASVVARALLHRLDFAGDDFVEAEGLARGARRPQRLGAQDLLL